MAKKEGSAPPRRAAVINGERPPPPELVFGIVGPIGVKLDGVIPALQEALERVGYDSDVIHLTDYMKNSRVKTRLDETSYFSRYMSLIKYANEYRRLARSRAALAGIAILQIRRRRSQQTHSSSTPATKRAYIIRQFKRPEEVDLMRRVYGRKFIQVSVFGGEQDRREVLVDKIRQHDASPKSEAECEREAIKLMDIDYRQSDDPNGQLIESVFHLGDVFVDGIDLGKASQTIERFVKAFFGYNRLSPNKDEYGMYVAAAASLRSVDLSRQVGAAIFTQRGEIVAMGCNEVPKPGGGTYWCDDGSQTYRDIDLGFDANQERRAEIIFDLIERLAQEGYINQKKNEASIHSTVDGIIKNERVRDAQIMDIIEFGRMIHAEMSAISDAARLGKAINETYMFSTAFPCHICAKHIVASGIRRVVFLEPYPKSYARKLHRDAISFDPSAGDKVRFEPFIGISPRRYRDIFERKRRKDDKGRAVDWYEGSPYPLVEDRGHAYIQLEATAAIYAMGSMYGAQPRSAKGASAQED